MPTLFLDLETFSATPITHGTHAYAANADILLVAYAWDDEAVQVADLTDTTLDINALVSRASKIVIHNSAFDRTVLRHNGVDLPIEKLHDTMVQAMAHSLPGSLGQLCDVMGVAIDKAKDKDGKKLIQLFTKPLGKNRILDRADRITHPEQWAAFIEYARLDVEAMRELYKRLPTWNYRDTEIVLWQLDQAINDRGIAVDLDLARAALRASDRAYKTLAQRANILTDGQVPSLTQRGKLLEYLEREHDFVPLDMTKGTVSAHLKNDLITPQVRELLDIRRQASATSPAKYKVLLNGTSSDGRLRGTLQFCGAIRTGRWCLAENTAVLIKDDVGQIYEKPIQDVHLADLVWDGESWVAHEGVVFSGDKNVIEHDGVVATSEHVVYLSTSESMPFGQAKAEGKILWRGNGLQFTG